MTTTRSRFRPAFIAKAGVLAAAIALTVQAGESKAQAAPGNSISCSINAIVDDTCKAPGDFLDKKFEIGDKAVTGLSFTGFTPGDLDTLLFTRITPTFFQLQYNFDPQAQSNTAGTFGYTISITPAGVADGNVLFRAQSNITGGTLEGGSFTTTATESAAKVTPLTATDGSSPSNPPGIFVPNTVSATFSQTFAASNNPPPGPATINSFGLQFTQTNIPTSVPGPLPILGAAAAFGLSRKLRNRIKQVA